MKNIEYSFDFSNLNEDHELFSKRNEKVVKKFKIKTPKKIWVDEFVCLRSKVCSFKCNDKIINKIKGISKSYSKNIKFGEHEKCLDEENYQQECD